MNLSDLAVVVALGSALYAVIIAVAGRRDFLKDAVNPHRISWLIAAVSLLWVGAGLLRWEAGSWSPQAWGPLLAQLVQDTPTPPKVKAASVALLLSLVFLSLVAYCWATMPRDPRTFRRPEDRQAAFRTYVTRMKGGLDYAVLACGDGEVLEEAFNARQVTRRCPYLPKVAPPGAGPRTRTLEDQLASWREGAGGIHAGMSQLDAVVERASHGRNVRLIFDTEYGGLFFVYLRTPDPRGGDGGVYLFGATLDQKEVNTQAAENHFNLLAEAMRSIDRNVRAG
jgi:hypothetical protein